MSYTYIKQMQHEQAIEETIKLIGVLIIDNNYEPIKELKETLGLTFINHCIKVINHRINS